VRLRIAAAVVAVAACVSAAGAAATAPRCPPGDLGTVAFVRGGALELLDLHGCATRTLVAAKVQRFGIQFSHDGRWVAFSGGFVSARGGPVHRVAGAGDWSPAADVLAIGTSKGGLELVGAGGRTRPLLPDGWGVHTDVFSPDGKTLAVSRSLYEGPSSPWRTWHQEIWLIDVATGRRRELFHLGPKQVAPAVLQGFSPDGRWLLFWEDSYNSASLAADGLPFLAVRVTGGRPVTIAPYQLGKSTFLAWCGGSLVYVIDHGGREVTEGDGIAITSPPAWRSKTILPAGGKTSWNSVACPTAAAAAKGGGGLAIAGGPTNGDSPFGQEHRSLWLVSPTPGAKPSRLSQTVAPKGQTDELPMWSRDGRWLLFVRTKPGGLSGRGSLYALDPFGGNLVGPIADVGTTGNSYGSYGWAGQIGWRR